MTRAEIVAAAAKRLGDESTSFLAVVDSFFNEVLRDLAAAEAISDLQQQASFTIVAAQEDYSTQTITGLAASTYPLRVLSIRVPSWGVAGCAPLFREAQNNQEYDELRHAMADAQGTARLWRTYPNRRQVQLWPPADTANAGAGLGRIVFLAPPTVIANGTELAELNIEDVETVVWGLIARGAPFRDETLADIDSAAGLYERGKRQMWGRLHNSNPKRVAPLDF